MPTKADYSKFQQLRAKWIVQQAKRQALESKLRGYYGGDYQSSWLKSSERKKLDAMRAAEDKISTAMFDLLDRVATRDFKSGVPSYWVMEHLTWEDATGTGPMGKTPPAAYGYSDADMRRRFG